MLSEKKDLDKLKKSEREHSNNTTAYGSRFLIKAYPNLNCPMKECLQQRLIS